MNRPPLDTNTLELVEPTDQILNSVADEVASNEIVSEPMQGVINRMLELSAGKGHSKHDSRQMVGLAALQLGVGLRVVTIDVTADGSNRPQNLHVLINPRITERSAEMVPGREACWSCGNICGNVKRAQRVEVEALDRTGVAVKYTWLDFVARIVQHEIDHLDGIRFPDRIPEDEPDKLHLVLPSEFPEYRLNWAHWQTRCPRQQWNSLKAGKAV